MARHLPKITIALAIVACLCFSTFPFASAQTTPKMAQDERQLPDVLRQMPEDMRVNHGMYDNRLTAAYEAWLNGWPVEDMLGATQEDKYSPFGRLGAMFGPDIRMSNPAFAGAQNEFQIDINPTDTRFAIGTSNDGRTAGVGIYRTTDAGQTWSAMDAPIGQSACCDPAVAYGSDGVVYVGVLDTSPAGQHTLRSVDNGATWTPLTFAPLPDRNNIAVDPRDSNIVYITYSALGSGANRIKGYRSTDGGQTWGESFFIGAPAPPQGYQQSSQPRVASDGTLYVGYQQYLNSGQGCAAGVQNVLAKSTDGGASFTHTVLNIVQGGACTPAQAGRGIFCINTANQSFRSRSHPIIAVHPTDPQIVYMVYSGGELDSPYTCGTATGFHSDTLFRRSTDGGATFSAPVKINRDGQGFDQYYPWIDVAPSGKIWVGWNDRRDDPSNFRSLWYQASSVDGGVTWNEQPVADVPTQPSTFIGDYMGIAAENDRVLGMWYDSRNTPSGDPYTDPGATAVTDPIVIVLSRDGSGDLRATITLTNPTSGPVPDVAITLVRASTLNGSAFVDGVPVPQSFGTVNPNQSVGAIVTFPGTAGVPPGFTGLIRVDLSYTGGNYSDTKQVVTP